jgi:hypothetical protein
MRKKMENKLKRLVLVKIDNKVKSEWERKMKNTHGLLAKATLIREQKALEIKEQEAMTGLGYEQENEQEPDGFGGLVAGGKAGQPRAKLFPKTPFVMTPKLRRIVAGIGLIFALKNPLTTVEMSAKNIGAFGDIMPTMETPVVYQFDNETGISGDNIHLANFMPERYITTEPQQDKFPPISENTREMFAKLLYGEAGIGADPFEVCHVVLNRAAKWKMSLEDVILQKNQFVGYRATNPVTEDYRAMVDQTIADWDKNGRTEIDGCGRFYFHSGSKKIPCNQFAIAQDGRWESRQQTIEGTYCEHATQQAETYFRHRNEIAQIAQR